MTLLPNISLTSRKQSIISYFKLKGNFPIFQSQLNKSYLKI